MRDSEHHSRPPTNPPQETAGAMTTALFVGPHFINRPFQALPLTPGSLPTRRLGLARITRAQTIIA
jgi:hypothetical protein